MKIICAGLSKTGTKSLSKALRILGFTVFDYDEHRDFHVDQWFEIYYEGKSPDFASMYKDVDAVADVPPAFWFEEIYEAFPDAKVILSLRDNEEVWAQSLAKQLEMIKSLGGLLNRILARAVLFLRWIRRKRSYFNLLGPINNAAYGSVNSKSTVIFKKKYREHNERVQAVIPKEKLLFYNVKQGWKPLCEFLGCDVPEVKFPRENVGLSFTHLKISEKLQPFKHAVFVILSIFMMLLSVYLVLYIVETS